MSESDGDQKRMTSIAPNVGFGDSRRLEPITRSFGYDRGQPIDRYYIEKFLNIHKSDISGHVVEVGDDRYTRQFGTKVFTSDIIDQDHPDSSPTVIADLTKAAHIPSNTFDCFIVTQTLQFIYDVHSAVNTIHRTLKHGGTMLASLPCVSPICRYDMDRWGDYWRFTSAACRRLFGDIFGNENIEIKAFGNVLVCTSFLYGLASQDLTQEELDFHDRDYEFLICIKAIKDDRTAA